ncbi:MAG: TfoX/Sxy family protein [Patescibacteria group bacterium]
MIKKKITIQSDEFQIYVLEQLSNLSGIWARRMFGGWGLYHGAKFFGIISKGRFYMKVSERTRGYYLAAGMKPFSPRSSQVLKSYYEVPLDVLENREELERWVTLSTD